MSKSFLKRKRKAIKTISKYKVFNKRTNRWEQRETNIEKKVRILLEQNNIEYLQEFSIWFGHKKRIYDFYCYKIDENKKKIYEVLLEVHGKYWHGESYVKGLKTKKKLNITQIKNIKNDKLKIKIAEKRNIPLIVFWEDTINKKPRFVINKIIEKIDQISNQKEKMFFYEDY